MNRSATLVTGTLWILALAVPTPAAETVPADWPEMRGGGGNGSYEARGWTPVTTMAEAKLLWKSEPLPGPYYGRSYNGGGTNTNAGFGSPVVAGDKVYVHYRIANEASYRSEDPAAQKALARLKERKADLVKAWGDHAFVAPVVDDEIACLELATGKTLWRRNLGPGGPSVSGGGKAGGHHTPCVRDGRVYVPTSNHLLRCLDAVTGEPLWAQPIRKDMNERYDAWTADVLAGKITGAVAGRGVKGLKIASRAAFPNSVPTVAAGVVAVGDGSNLLGFDAATSEPRWRVAGCCARDHSPVRWVRDGKEFLLVGNRGSLTCIDAATGKVIWRHEDPLGISNGFTLYRDHVIVKGAELTCDTIDMKRNRLALQDCWVLGTPFPQGTRYQGMACYRLGPKGPVLVWRQPFPAEQGDPIPVVHRGHVYTLARIGPKRSDYGDGAYNYFYTCVDFATGDEVARINHAGKIACINYKAIGDMIIVGNAEEILRADPGDFRQIKAHREARMTECSSCHPAIAGHLMVLRGPSHIRCYDLRSDQEAEELRPFRPNRALGKKVLASGNAEAPDGKLGGRPKYDGRKGKAAAVWGHRTLKGGNRRFLACKAVDGTAETMWRWPENQSDAWLVIDIAAPTPKPAPRAIDRIVVEAVPAKGETLALTLSVGDGPEGPWKKVGTGKASAGKGTVAIDGVGATARFVKVDIAGAVTTERLAAPCGIAEVKVYEPVGEQASRR